MSEETHNPQQEKVIIPHWILPVKQIGAFILFFTLPVGLLGMLFAPEPYKAYVPLLLGVTLAIFLYYSLMTYIHSNIRITEDGLVIRKGWIPHTSNTIFWPSIKDVDSAAGVLESLVGAGTIQIKVAVRQDDEEIKIPFIPDYETLFNYIRERVGSQYKDIKTITHT